MKLSNLSSLDSHHVKKTGILFSVFFILLWIVAKTTGTLEKNDIRLINLYILVALLLTAFSKEKTDDERNQIIRYFSLKLSFRLLIAGLAVLYILKLNIESIYFAIASLILYLTIFYLASYFNPNFIFREDTKKNKAGIKITVTVMIIIGIALTYNIISEMLIS